MKKIVIITILFSVLIFPVHAGKYHFSVDAHLPLSKNVVYPGYEDKVSEVDGIPITARSVVVMDVETGKIIYELNPFLKGPIASITKLMSLVIFIESGVDLGGEIIVEGEDLTKLSQYTRKGDIVSQLQLVSGDRLQVKDAVYSGIIRSANDAVSMFVRSTKMNDNKFVERMNERAQVLGLYDTHFTEPTGLDPRNISTASDIAKLARYAFKNDLIKRVTTTRDYSFKTSLQNQYYLVKNTNSLLTTLHPFYYRIVGGKTGYLNESRYNVVTQIRNRQGKEIIVVVLGAETDEKRFNETKELAIKAFEKIE